MRLAYLSTDPGIAYGGTKGASVHVQELVTALADAGAEILLLVGAQARDAPPVPRGVTVEVLPGPGKGAPRRPARRPPAAAYSDRATRAAALSCRRSCKRRTSERPGVSPQAGIGLRDVGYGVRPTSWPRTPTP